MSSQIVSTFSKKEYNSCLNLSNLVAHLSNEMSIIPNSEEFSVSESKISS